MSLLPFLHRVAARENLSTGDAREAMNAILEGSASTPVIAAFLVALGMKGETADELLGFATAMRNKAARVDAGAGPLLDTCGTGGAVVKTFNVSTVAAFVAAGAGVRVAKHGNRSISSRCGSADILEALGIRIDLEADETARAIRETGIGFLFAPKLHPAMKYAQPARLEIKMRTAFNLLGPLTNPAGATCQLIGVASAEAAELIAGALAGFEPERAFVVHGSDGLDEVTTTGSTLVFEVAGNRVTRKVWNPSDFGVPVAALSSLAGGERDVNCGIAQRVLGGALGPQRDIVVANAAAALLAAGEAATPREGAALAEEAIDGGKALAKVTELAAFTAEARAPGALHSFT